MLHNNTGNIESFSSRSGPSKSKSSASGISSPYNLTGRDNLNGQSAEIAPRPSAYGQSSKPSFTQGVGTGRGIRHYPTVPPCKSMSNTELLAALVHRTLHTDEDETLAIDFYGNEKNPSKRRKKISGGIGARMTTVPYDPDQQTLPFGKAEHKSIKGAASVRQHRGPAGSERGPISIKGSAGETSTSRSAASSRTVEMTSKATTSTSKTIEIDSDEEEGPTAKDDRESIQAFSDDDHVSDARPKAQNSAQRLVQPGHVSRVAQAYTGKAGHIHPEPPVPANGSEDEICLIPIETKKKKQVLSMQGRNQAAIDQSTGQAKLKTQTSSRRSRSDSLPATSTATAGPAQRKDRPIPVFSLPIRLQYDVFEVADTILVLHKNMSIPIESSVVLQSKHRPLLEKITFRLNDVARAQTTKLTDEGAAIFLTLHKECKAAKCFTTTRE